MDIIIISIIDLMEFLIMDEPAAHQLRKFAKSCGAFRII